VTRDRDLALPDPWAALRRHTPARIALGRAGSALPLSEVLRLELAHAQARDAVHRPLALEALLHDLRAQGRSPVVVASAARDRSTYLTRPDLGRQLADPAALPAATWGEQARIAVLIGDGLSTLGVERHAAPLLAALSDLSPWRWRAAPVVVALQARVALGDDVGARLGAELVLVLVGERPGLSSCDSLGAYLTHDPRPGRCDAERNCISNIRPEGLSYAAAARRIDWLAAEALRRGCTGVALKDESDVPALPKPG
jgi:ethanolamine ammonia-lyase small subunit